MSAAGAKLKGYLVGPTDAAVLADEVFSHPPEEQARRFRELLRRERLEAEENARQRVDELLRNNR